jgi:hypothetical protein
VYSAITFRLFSRFRTERHLQRRLRLTLQSGLFDPKWYLNAYPDLAVRGIDPLRHYCETGFREARRPGPNADDAAVSALARELGLT